MTQFSETGELRNLHASAAGLTVRTRHLRIGPAKALVREDAYKLVR